MRVRGRRRRGRGVALGSQCGDGSAQLGDRLPDPLGLGAHGVELLAHLGGAGLGARRAFGLAVGAPIGGAGTFVGGSPGDLGRLGPRDGLVPLVLGPRGELVGDARVGLGGGVEVGAGLVQLGGKVGAELLELGGEVLALPGGLPGGSVGLLAFGLRAALGLLGPGGEAAKL
ncbi:hypothetical protein [Georgenia daeguensis]|uniref:Uncharacterized protein n=1 Tax=Georgenia daeguensis TaxID=908355 RepID=A0ABP6UPM9_9MICO